MIEVEQLKSHVCSLCASADGKIYVFEKDARTVRVIRDGGGGGSSSSSVASLPSTWLHACGASPCASGIIICDRFFPNTQNERYNCLVIAYGSGHHRIKLLHSDDRTLSNVAGDAWI